MRAKRMLCGLGIVLKASGALACTIVDHIPSGSVITVGNIAYGHGADQTGILNIPAGVINPPVVLLIHGGGFVSGSAEHLQHTATSLAYNASVAVFNINYDEVDPKRNLNNIYNQEVRDGRCAAKWLARSDMGARYKFNHANLGVVGFSAGGALAITVATSTDGDDIDDPTCPQLNQVYKVKAVAVFYPSTQFPGSSRYNTPGTASAPIVYASLHPTLVATQHWMLANGSDDTTVPVDQTPIMTQALRSAGAAVDYSATIRGLPHGFSPYAIQKWPAEVPATCAMQALYQNHL